MTQSMLEALGMAPKREEEIVNGFVRVTVTPPEFMDIPGASVTLTLDQFARYTKWRVGGVLIQDILPELSLDQREILMTGLSDEHFHRAAGSDPGEEEDEDQS